MAEAEATEVVVIRGAGYNPRNRTDYKRLIVERDAVQIAEIAELVARQVLDSEPVAWMEWPAMSIVFLDGRSVMAEYGLLSNLTYVRHPGGGDYPVASPEALRAWLLRHEVDGLRLELD